MARASKPFSLSEQEREAMNYATWNFLEYQKIIDDTFSGKFEDHKTLAEIHKNSKNLHLLIVSMLEDKNAAAFMEIEKELKYRVLYDGTSFKIMDIAQIIKELNALAEITEKYSRQGKRVDSKTRKWIETFEISWRHFSLKPSVSPNSRFVKVLMDHTPPDLPQVGSVDLVRSTLASLSKRATSR